MQLRIRRHPTTNELRVPQFLRDWHLLVRYFQPYVHVSQLYTDEGQEYYYNEGSEVTQWDKPADLTGEWTKASTDEGQDYFYHTGTQQTQ